MSVVELQSEREHYCLSRVSTEDTLLSSHLFITFFNFAFEFFSTQLHFITTATLLMTVFQNVSDVNAAAVCALLLHVKCDVSKFKWLTPGGPRLEARRTWSRCADVCQCADVFLLLPPKLADGRMVDIVRCHV